jgi:hypothetical protein
MRCARAVVRMASPRADGMPDAKAETQTATQEADLVLSGFIYGSYFKVMKSSTDSRQSFTSEAILS